jgi:hypothetical protein
MSTLEKLRGAVTREIDSHGNEPRAEGNRGTRLRTHESYTPPDNRTPQVPAAKYKLGFRKGTV